VFIFVCVCVRIPLPLFELYELRKMRGGGLGSSTIFKKFVEPYAPS